MKPPRSNATCQALTRRPRLPAWSRRLGDPVSQAPQWRLAIWMTARLIPITSVPGLLGTIVGALPEALGRKTILYQLSQTG